MASEIVPKYTQAKYVGLIENYNKFLLKKAKAFYVVYITIYSALLFAFLLEFGVGHLLHNVQIFLDGI